MPIKDMRRMKALMNVIYKYAPDLDPRIDRFTPAPGHPDHAVVVEVFEGYVRECVVLMPAVRLVAWPEGNVWQIVKMVYDPLTTDVQDVAPYDEPAYSDKSAPRWLFGAVHSFLSGVLIPTLDAFQADDWDGLPADARKVFDPVRRRAERIAMIYGS